VQSHRSIAGLHWEVSDFVVALSQPAGVWRAGWKPTPQETAGHCGAGVPPAGWWSGIGHETWARQKALRCL